MKSLFSSSAQRHHERDMKSREIAENGEVKLMVYKPLHKRYNGRWAVGNQPTQPKRHSTEAT